MVGTGRERRSTANRLAFPFETSDATLGDGHRKWLAKDEFVIEKSTWAFRGGFYCEVLKAAQLQDVVARTCGYTAPTPLERHWPLQ